MMGCVDNLLYCICRKLGIRISRKRAYRRARRWIKDQLREDPEATIPVQGVRLIYAFKDCIHEDINDDIHDDEEIERLFSIRGSIYQVLQPYGMSPHASEIAAIVEQKKEGVNKVPKAMGYKRWAQIMDDFNDELLCSILERCIQHRKNVLQPKSRALELVFRRAPVKGHQLGMRYFLTQPTYTVGLRDNTGSIRDYFVILRQRITKDRPLLILYMAITHTRLKTNGRNSVVYGLHTNMGSFAFYKIDCSSRLFATYGSFDTFNQIRLQKTCIPYSEACYDVRRFWDTKNERWRLSWSGAEEFVTQVDNILEAAEKHCHEVGGLASEWTDELFLKLPSESKPVANKCDNIAFPFTNSPRGPRQRLLRRLTV